MTLIDEVRGVLDGSPQTAALLDLGPFEGFADLAGALLARICDNRSLGETVTRVYETAPELVEMSCHDIAETARRNFEPGGAAATLLFARGVQAVMAHRVAHQLWMAGDQTLALAVKSITARAFATDIHPGARIGAGFWLDHGLGFVAGETTVIEEDVSIWHNVTLGSTLNDSGAQRHPQIGRGAVIGAGAMVLGGIRVGAGANIAAGAVVVSDVPEGALVVGSKAQVRGAAKVSFVPEKGSQG